MKKLILILLYLPLIGFGQITVTEVEKNQNIKFINNIEFAKSFEIGFEIGPSLTSLDGHDIISNETFQIPAGMEIPSGEYKISRESTIKKSFSGGLSFQYNSPKIFSIKTNITYERKGPRDQTVSYTDTLGNVKVISEQVDVDYLTIPILARFSYGKRTKFFFNTGPYFSYILYSEKNTVYTKWFDMGLILGTGCVFLINDQLLMTTEVRNNIGFYNIALIDRQSIKNNGKLKNQSINFLLGISYIWNKKTT